MVLALRGQFRSGSSPACENHSSIVAGTTVPRTLGAIAGGVTACVVCVAATMPLPPRCRQCGRRHRDFWEDPICGDGFRWWPKNLVSNEQMWLTQDHTAVVVGVTFELTVRVAQEEAATIFRYAAEQQLIASIGDVLRIQRRELNRLMISVAASPRLATK